MTKRRTKIVYIIQFRRASEKKTQEEGQGIDSSEKELDYVGKWGREPR